MASIVIRNVDEGLKQRLRARAADHGQSMAAEARDILEQALDGGDSIPPATNLYDAIRKIVQPLGGIELDLAPHEPIREPS
jgi:plasmid stability protein